MDDIIVFSTSLKTHSKFKIGLFQIKRNPVKNSVRQMWIQVQFLGHVEAPEGIRPNPFKIQAIRKYRITRTQTVIKSFLSLPGCYRKFIGNFAKITKPFTNWDNKVDQNISTCHKSIALKNCFHKHRILQIWSQEYYKFEELKKMLAGKRSDCDEEVITKTEVYSEAFGKSFYKKVIEILERHWNDCIIPKKKLLIYWSRGFLIHVCFLVWPKRELRHHYTRLPFDDVCAQLHEVYMETNG